VKKADILVGLLILFLSAAMFIMTRKFVGHTYTGYGPERFPRFLALAWGILGLCLIINALRNKFFEEEMKITRFGLGRMAVVLGVTVATLVSMDYLGFLAATVIYIFIVMTYLKEKSWLGRILASFGIATSVYLIFRYIMVVPLPEFRLFQL